MAHEYLGNIDEAVSFYKKAVTLNPSLIDYFENKRRKLKEAGLWNASNEREKS
jgi:tetratricopeptide (TPR) repeat protein